LRHKRKGAALNTTGLILKTEVTIPQTPVYLAARQNEILDLAFLTNRQRSLLRNGATPLIREPLDRRRLAAPKITKTARMAPKSKILAAMSKQIANKFGSKGAAAAALEHGPDYVKTYKHRNHR